jgi:hypothetical protein
MGNKIGVMLAEAMSPKVEPLGESANEGETSALITGDESKKKVMPLQPS